MIYLDYSANTPVDEAVLERFCAVERSCPGNANSRRPVPPPKPPSTRPRRALPAAFMCSRRRSFIHPVPARPTILR